MSIAYTVPPAPLNHAYSLRHVVFEPPLVIVDDGDETRRSTLEEIPVRTTLPELDRCHLEMRFVRNTQLPSTWRSLRPFDLDAHYAYDNKGEGHDLKGAY